MFSKAYKLKSNNTLKNSERKQLIQRMVENFPAVTEEKIKELVPNKASASCMRVTTHAGDTVAVFVVDGTPLLLETAQGFYPTVCALWKLPELLPIITMHAAVLGKVQNGAPLYLPGVVIPVQGQGFPRFLRGVPVAVNTETNCAAALVGTAVMSSGDMLLKGSGMCLEVLHVIRDFLCKDIKFGKIERPKLGPASYGSTTADTPLPDLTRLNLKGPIAAKEEWPSLGPRRELPPPAPVAVEPVPVVEDTSEPAPAPPEQPDSSTVPDDTELNEDALPPDMDGLLRWCLLRFLKLEGRRVQLPLKTNLLYKNHLIPLCPADRTLHVKSSTYKKMGKFLDAMQMEGLIETREVEKGVSALVAVNMAHPALRAHAVAADHATPAPAPAPEPERDYTPPVVRELLAVTAHAAPLLPPHRKGTALTAAEARAAFAHYVASRQLRSPTDARMLRPDDALRALLPAATKSQQEVPWEEAWGALSQRLTASTELRFADGAVTLLRAKLAPVTMQLQQRSGNKKVTLVSNLEAFGFSLAALSRAWQARAAAAVTVTRSAGSARDQLLLQGDQTYFVARTLVEEYGLPKKFVEGADRALSKKRR